MKRLGLVLQSRQNTLLVKDLEIDKSRIEAKELEKENLRLALELEKENRRLAKELERENRKLSKELERDKLRPPTRKLDKTNLKLENEPETTTTSKKVSPQRCLCWKKKISFLKQLMLYRS